VADARRETHYADNNGYRLHVEQTVRSHRAHGLVGQEFQASIGGIRVGDFATLALAQAVLLRLTNWPKKSGEPR